jgi:predicted TPR repeat methyltransferase
MKQSIFYRNPRLYSIYLRLCFPFFTVDKRFKSISKEIGKNQRVLDIACGPGILLRYLDNSCTYNGFDLNEKFIAHINKKHNFNLKTGNVTDEKSYSNADVIVAMDILHHIPRKQRKKVIELCLKYANKKLIVCEPFVPPFFKKKSWFSKVAEHLFESTERNGFNKVTINQRYYEEELEKEMQDKFNAKKKIRVMIKKNIAGHLTAIYEK